MSSPFAHPSRPVAAAPAGVLPLPADVWAWVEAMHRQAPGLDADFSLEVLTAADHPRSPAAGWTVLAAVLTGRPDPARRFRFEFRLPGALDDDTLRDLCALSTATDRPLIADATPVL